MYNMNKYRRNIAIILSCFLLLCILLAVPIIFFSCGYTEETSEEITTSTFVTHTAITTERTSVTTTRHITSNTTKQITNKTTETKETAPKDSEVTSASTSECETEEFSSESQSAITQATSTEKQTTSNTTHNTSTATCAASTTEMSELTTTEWTTASDIYKGCYVRFSRGTYYTAPNGAHGGSQRTLVDCASGNEDVRGSVASYYLWRNFGYNYNGSRTKIYVEVDDHSEMDGVYYLDDCSAMRDYYACGRYIKADSVIDFFYVNGKNCPFSRDGVVGVDCWVLE